MSTLAVPLETPSPARVLISAVPIGVALLIVPFVLDQYQTILLAYGLVMAIAALGFNLLLGYTGLLSFGLLLIRNFAIWISRMGSPKIKIALSAACLERLF